MDLWMLYAGLTGALLLGTVGLELIARLDQHQTEGERGSDRLCQAPALDAVMAYFTLVPNVAGLAMAGGLGFLVAIAAQATALITWVTLHELRHYRLWQGPKISRTLSRLVGNWQNHLALWTTLPAFSAFWLVRLYELALYPILTRTVRFPKYEGKDWVNLSRHKFEGLVGYDLVWCLYCDWMTGVWSLGTEMLRNVESFWCPIRFYPDKKCKNCQIDFPDLEGGWVPAEASLKDVVQTLEEKYSGDQDNAWYGHSSRQAEADVSNANE